MLLLILSSALSVGQQQPPKWSPRVQLTVDGEEQAVTLIKSYVSREFRALGDIVAVDTAPDYHLSIVVLTITGGYAMSMVADAPYNVSNLREMLEDLKLKPDVVGVLASWLKDGSIVKGHWLKTCPSAGLEVAIKEVVANFDVGTLQPGRDIWQKLIEAKQKAKQD